MVYMDKTSPVFPQPMSIDNKTPPLFSSTKAERKKGNCRGKGVGLFWSERWFSSKNACSCWVPSTHIRGLTAASNPSPMWRWTQRIVLFSCLPTQQLFCSHKTRNNSDFKFYYLGNIFHMEYLDSNSSDGDGQ